MHLGAILSDVGVAGAALLVGIFGMLYTAIGMRRKADTDYVATLEKRLEDAEKRADESDRRHARCEESRQALMEEYLRLMKKVLGLS